MLCAVYRAMFQETLPADTRAQFRKSTEAGEVIGDNRFCAEIKRVLARRIERDGHGGDRRSAKFRVDPLIPRGQSKPRVQTGGRESWNHSDDSWFLLPRLV